MSIRTFIKEEHISFDSVIVTQDFTRIEDNKKGSRLGSALINLNKTVH